MASNQNKIIASFSSGRGNTLDILLPDEEIKGTGPRFVNVSFAQRVAASLNTIFKNKFKITFDAFCVEELVIPEPINLKPEADFFSPLTWKNSKINDLITDLDIYLSLNDAFNWGQDDITKAIYEFHTEKKAGRTIIININNKLVLDRNGGYVHDTRTVFLYDQYAKRGIGIIPNKKRYPFFIDQGGDSKWKLGGVYIHEIMYHIYPDDFGQGDLTPNYIRSYLELAENTGPSKKHKRGPYQRGREFWKEVRQKNLKTIWRKNNQ